MQLGPALLALLVLAGCASPALPPRLPDEPARLPSVRVHEWTGTMCIDNVAADAATGTHVNTVYWDCQDPVEKNSATGWHAWYTEVDFADDDLSPLKDHFGTVTWNVTWGPEATLNEFDLDPCPPGPKHDECQRQAGPVRHLTTKNEREGRRFSCSVGLGQPWSFPDIHTAYPAWVYPWTSAHDWTVSLTVDVSFAADHYVQGCPTS